MAHVFLSSSGNPIIWPPVIIAKQNDQVDIVNHTEKDIFVIYPENVFAAGSARQGPGQVRREEGRQGDKKVANDADKGLHRFKVFCFETNSFAQGNSDPEFIIE